MNPSVRLAGQQDLNTLVHIWQACFGDPEATIRAFFSHFCGHIRSLLLETEGEAAAALHLLDIAELVAGRTVRPCPYVYAVGVLPKFRGRGYGRLLSAEAARRQPPCTLVPADAGLFAFYEKTGFQTMFTVSERVFLRGEGLPQPCDSAQYSVLRERCLEGTAHLRFSPVAVDYLAAICQESGGGLYRSGTAIAAVECLDGVPYIKELLGQAVDELAGGIARRYGVPFCKARLPGADQPFGMYAAQDAWLEPAYFGFAFD